MLDQDTAGGHGREHAVLAEDRRPQLRVIEDDGNDHVRVPHRFLHGAGAPQTGRFGSRPGRRPPGQDDRLMPGRAEPVNDRAAHAAGADNPDTHNVLLGHVI